MPYLISQLCWLGRDVTPHDLTLAGKKRRHLFLSSPVLFHLPLLLYPPPSLSSSITSLARAIMSMDARDQFPVDMVEQMLKFTPSPEERVGTILPIT